MLCLRIRRNESWLIFPSNTFMLLFFCIYLIVFFMLAFMAGSLENFLFLIFTGIAM